MLRDITRGVVVTVAVFAILEGVSAIGDPYKQNYYKLKFNHISDKVKSTFK